MPPQPRTLQASASAPGGFEDPDATPSAQLSLRQGMRSSNGLDNAAPRSGPAPVALYAMPSYSTLYVEPQDPEPGPGTYDVPSNFGYQQLSTVQSQPALSLTAKHEKSWDKVYITKDHLMSQMARGTPGPGTYVPEQVQTQARVRFGTSRRRDLADCNFRAPGPVYDLEVDPLKEAARVKFGKASRFNSVGSSLAASDGSAAPGQYEAKSSFDTNLAKSFGSSHRAYDKVRFPGSERAELCKASPGPGAAVPFQNNGKSVAFSTAERLPFSKDGKRAPGPGRYDNHNIKDPSIRNQSCYSFGRPNPRGRIDYKQIRLLSHSKIFNE